MPSISVSPAGQAWEQAATLAGLQRMANPHRTQLLQGLARQTGRRAGRLALSPAQPEGRSAGGHGGAPAAASALHTVSKCDPKTGNQGKGGSVGLVIAGMEGWRGCRWTRLHPGWTVVTRGLDSACQHPWEPPGHRLPGPVGATRSPPAGTRGITLSELLLRPCQAPAKRACP